MGTFAGLPGCAICTSRPRKTPGVQLGVQLTYEQASRTGYSSASWSRSTARSNSPASSVAERPRSMFSARVSCRLGARSAGSSANLVGSNPASAGLQTWAVLGIARSGRGGKPAPLHVVAGNGSHPAVRLGEFENLLGRLAALRVDDLDEVPAAQFVVDLSRRIRPNSGLSLGDTARHRPAVRPLIGNPLAARSRFVAAHDHWLDRTSSRSVALGVAMSSTAVVESC
jgi:hypothetical protein